MKRLIISIVSTLMIGVWTIAIFLLVQDESLKVSSHSARSNATLSSYEKVWKEDLFTKLENSKEAPSEESDSYANDGRVSIDRLLDALHLVK